MGGASLDYYAPKLLDYLSTATAPSVPKEEIEKLKAETAAAKRSACVTRGMGAPYAGLAT